MSGSLSSSGSIASTFRTSAQARKPDRRKRTPPVSIRFSDEERARLASFAGEQPLSRYVRDFVLKGHDIAKRRKSAPAPERKEIAQLLSALGRSELASLLRDTLAAIDDGGLLLEPDTEADLRLACAEISKMRCDLMKALGMRGDIVP